MFFEFGFVTYSPTSSSVGFSGTYRIRDGNVIESGLFAIELVVS